MLTATLDPADAARRLAGHAKTFGAGAFGSPTRKELEAHPERIWWWPAHGFVAYARTLARPSRRASFTGDPFQIPAGATVIEHVAHEGTIPDLSKADVVMGYVEDEPMRAALAGRPKVATRITAAAEVIGVWGSPGDSPERLGAADQVTLARLPLLVPPEVQRQALAEVASIDQWHDDYPFYSDGTWGAVSLRGFRRDDPTWGVKPAEMPKRWKADHPEALGYRCQWTVLADRTPALQEITRLVSYGGRLERVRLLRMASRPGGGKLGRHTDITDRSAGTRDGDIIRLHVPIVTHPQVMMHAWTLGGTHTRNHLPAWSCWYLDARKPHAVTNPSPVSRVHLTVDMEATPEFRRLLVGEGCAR